jgi:hypothetical protein
MWKPTIIIFGLTLALPQAGLAERISTKEQLNAYLSEHLQSGQMVERSISTGYRFKAHSNNGTCWGPYSISKFPFIIEKLFESLMIDLVTTAEDHSLDFSGNNPGCEYKVIGFSNNKLAKLGITPFRRDDGKLQIGVPLTKQEFLGTEAVDLSGQKRVGRTDCDVYFKPWFRNYEPSDFALKFKDAIIEDGAYAGAFSEEATTTPWCFQEKYDGTYKWVYWSRY